VSEQTERVRRLEDELWTSPRRGGFIARRGVPGDARRAEPHGRHARCGTGRLTRFDTPRQLAAFVGLIPERVLDRRGARLGPITKAGNGHARRALVEAAWAYRYPAKVSAHLQLRLERCATPIQDIAWNAQVRLCTRDRRLVARGKNPNIVVTAIAREILAFLWAIAGGADHTLSNGQTRCR